MNPELKQLLARQSAARRSAAMRRWLVVGIFAIVLPFAVMAFADSRTPLDKPWRWLALAMLAIALLWSLMRMSRAMRTPAERDVAGLLDEQAALDRGYAISTSAELKTPRTELPEESLLLERLHSEAGRLAASAPLRHPGARFWQVAGALAGVVLLALVLGREGLRPVMRMILPWEELPYTTLTLSGPEKKPLAREPFTVTGKVSGRLPATLVIQPADGPAIQVPVNSDGSYRYVFEKGVLTPVVLTARGGSDGVSAPLAIELGNIPQVVEYAHRITPPAYTKEPERIEKQASFTILRASRVSYVARFDRKPTAVRLIFDNDLGTLDLEADPAQPLVWGLQLPLLKRTCGYTIEVAEADGIFRAMGEPQQIVVTPDKPPVVEIASHNADKIKSRKDTFTMNFSANDDIGLANMRVLYRRVGDEEKQMKEIPLSQPGVRKQNGTWQLPLGEIEAQPHDMIAIVVQARDGNSLDGPGVGNSEPILLEIPEEKSDKADEEQQAAAGGGSGTPPEQVNPLEIQQQLYRDTLRLSLGRKAPAKDELQRRQQENVKNLAEMAQDPKQAQLGAEYLGLLEQARKSASQAASYLQMRPGTYYQGQQSADPMERALVAEAAVIDSLLKAARIAENQPPSPPAAGEGEGEGPPGKQFSLTKSNSPKGAPPTEEEKKEQIEKTLTDLNEAIKKQEEINKEIAEQKPGDQQGEKGEKGEKGEDGKQGEPGEQPGQQPGETAKGEGQQPGQPSPGEGKQPGSQPGSQQGSQASQSPEGTPPGKPGQAGQQSPSLAQEQAQAGQLSEKIRAQLEALGKSDGGADPAMAAEQMKQAAQFQKLAAEAIAKGGAGNAQAPGQSSANALRKAQQLTESLLDQTPDGLAEPRAQALEYQHLIQEYTRRLSYDD